MQVGLIVRSTLITEVAPDWRELMMHIMQLLIAHISVQLDPRSIQQIYSHANCPVAFTL